MKGTLTVIRIDGRRDITALPTAPTLDQLRAAVGGAIEVIPFFTKFEGRECVAFCHEEGKLEGLAANPVAQGLWERAVRRRISADYLVGPIAIITGDAELLRAL